MTTTQIATYASIGNISTPDVDNQVILRRNIIPDFFERIGRVDWRRSAATTLTIDAREKDLPNDFDFMAEIAIGEDDPMSYIGDMPEKVLAWEQFTDTAQPEFYWFVPTATLAQKRIRFNVTPDRTYTATYVYYRQPYFADDSTPVEMNQYVPLEFQWGLVEGLKAYLYEVRFGQNDNRWQVANTKYEAAIEKAAFGGRKAHTNKVVIL